MNLDRLTEFDYCLDLAEENKLFFSFLYSEDFSSIEEFVCMYLTKVEGVFKEVVKYDFSKRERLHVHYFYKKWARKEYLDFPTTLDTLFFLKGELEGNWRKHLIKFREG